MSLFDRGKQALEEQKKKKQQAPQATTTAAKPVQTSNGPKTGAAFINRTRERYGTPSTSSTQSRPQNVSVNKPTQKALGAIGSFATAAFRDAYNRDKSAYQSVHNIPQNNPGNKLVGNFVDAIVTKKANSNYEYLPQNQWRAPQATAWARQHGDSAYLQQMSGMVDDASSPYWNPYLGGRNTISEAGLNYLAPYSQEGQIYDQKWYDDNISLRQYLRYTDTGEVSKPGKKGTAQEWAAWYHNRVGMYLKENTELNEQFAEYRQDVQKYVDDYTYANGHAPTLEELMEYVPISNYNKLAALDQSYGQEKKVQFLPMGTFYSADIIPGLYNAAINGKDLSEDRDYFEDAVEYWQTASSSSPSVDKYEWSGKDLSGLSKEDLNRVLIGIAEQGDLEQYTALQKAWYDAQPHDDSVASATSLVDKIAGSYHDQAWFDTMAEKYGDILAFYGGPGNVSTPKKGASLEHRIAYEYDQQLKLKDYTDALENEWETFVDTVNEWAADSLSDYGPEDFENFKYDVMVAAGFDDMDKLDAYCKATDYTRKETCRPVFASKENMEQVLMLAFQGKTVSSKMDYTSDPSYYDFTEETPVDKPAAYDEDQRQAAVDNQAQRDMEDNSVIDAVTNLSNSNVPIRKGELEVLPESMDVTPEHGGVGGKAYLAYIWGNEKKADYDEQLGDEYTVEDMAASDPVLAQLDTDNMPESVSTNDLLALNNGLTMSRLRGEAATLATGIMGRALPGLKQLGEVVNDLFDRFEFNVAYQLAQRPIDTVAYKTTYEKLIESGYEERNASRVAFYAAIEIPESAERVSTDYDGIGELQDAAKNLISEITKEPGAMATFGIIADINEQARDFFDEMGIPHPKSFGLDRAYYKMNPNATSDAEQEDEPVDLSELNTALMIGASSAAEPGYQNQTNQFLYGFMNGDITAEDIVEGMKFRSRMRRAEEQAAIAAEEQPTEDIAAGMKDRARARQAEIPTPEEQPVQQMTPELYAQLTDESRTILNGGIYDLDEQLSPEAKEFFDYDGIRAYAEEYTKTLDTPPEIIVRSMMIQAMTDFADPSSAYHSNDLMRDAGDVNVGNEIAQYANAKSDEEKQNNIAATQSSFFTKPVDEGHFRLALTLGAFFGADISDNHRVYSTLTNYGKFFSQDEIDALSGAYYNGEITYDELEKIVNDRATKTGNLHANYMYNVTDVREAKERQTTGLENLRASAANIPETVQIGRELSSGMDVDEIIAKHPTEMGHIDMENLRDLVGDDDATIRQRLRDIVGVAEERDVGFFDNPQLDAISGFVDYVNELGPDGYIVNELDAQQLKTLTGGAIDLEAAGLDGYTGGSLMSLVDKDWLKPFTKNPGNNNWTYNLDSALNQGAAGILKAIPDVVNWADQAINNGETTIDWAARSGENLREIIGEQQTHDQLVSSTTEAFVNGGVAEVIRNGVNAMVGGQIGQAVGAGLSVIEPIFSNVAKLETIENIHNAITTLAGRSLLFAGASSSAFQEKRAAGESFGKSSIKGILSGSIELFTESNVEKMFFLGDKLGGLLESAARGVDKAGAYLAAYAFKQAHNMVTEIGEEETSVLLDRLIEYVDQRGMGTTHEKAWEQFTDGLGEEMLSTAKATAFSTALFSAIDAGGTAYNRLKYSYDHNTDVDYDALATDMLIDLITSMAEAEDEEPVEAIETDNTVEGFYGNPDNFDAESAIKTKEDIVNESRRAARERNASNMTDHTSEVEAISDELSKPEEEGMSRKERRKRGRNKTDDLLAEKIANYMLEPTQANADAIVDTAVELSESQQEPAVVEQEQNVEQPAEEPVAAPESVAEPAEEEGTLNKRPSGRYGNRYWALTNDYINKRMRPRQAVAQSVEDVQAEYQNLTPGAQETVKYLDGAQEAQDKAVVNKHAEEKAQEAVQNDPGIKAQQDAIEQQNLEIEKLDTEAAEHQESIQGDTGRLQQSFAAAAEQNIDPTLPSPVMDNARQALTQRISAAQAKLAEVLKKKDNVQKKVAALQKKLEDSIDNLVEQTKLDSINGDMEKIEKRRAELPQRKAAIDAEREGHRNQTSWQNYYDKVTQSSYLVSGPFTQEQYNNPDLRDTFIEPREDQWKDENKQKEQDQAYSAQYNLEQDTKASERRNQLMMDYDSATAAVVDETDPYYIPISKKLYDKVAAAMEKAGGTIDDRHLIMDRVRNGYQSFLGLFDTILGDYDFVGQNSQYLIIRRKADPNLAEKTEIYNGLANGGLERGTANLREAQRVAANYTSDYINAMRKATELRTQQHEALEKGDLDTVASLGTQIAALEKEAERKKNQRDIVQKSLRTETERHNRNLALMEEFGKAKESSKDIVIDKRELDDLDTDKIEMKAFSLASVRFADKVAGVSDDALVTLIRETILGHDAGSDAHKRALANSLEEKYKWMSPEDISIELFGILMDEARDEIVKDALNKASKTVGDAWEFIKEHGKGDRFSTKTGEYEDDTTTYKISKKAAYKYLSDDERKKVGFKQSLEEYNEATKTSVRMYAEENNLTDEEAEAILNDNTVKVVKYNGVPHYEVDADDQFSLMIAEKRRNDDTANMNLRDTNGDYSLGRTFANLGYKLQQIADIAEGKYNRPGKKPWTVQPNGRDSIKIKYLAKRADGTYGYQTRIVGEYYKNENGETTLWIPTLSWIKENAVELTGNYSTEFFKGTDALKQSAVWYKIVLNNQVKQGETNYDHIAEDNAFMRTGAELKSEIQSLKDFAKKFSPNNETKAKINKLYANAMYNYWKHQYAAAIDSASEARNDTVDTYLDAADHAQEKMDYWSKLITSDESSLYDRLTKEHMAIQKDYMDKHGKPIDEESYTELFTTVESYADLLKEARDRYQQLTTERVYSGVGGPFEAEREVLARLIPYFEQMAQQEQEGIPEDQKQPEPPGNPNADAIMAEYSKYSENWPTEKPREQLMKDLATIYEESKKNPKYDGARTAVTKAYHENATKNMTDDEKIEYTANLAERAQTAPDAPTIDPNTDYGQELVNAVQAKADKLDKKQKQRMKSIKAMASKYKTESNARKALADFEAIVEATGVDNAELREKLQSNVDQFVNPQQAIVEAAIDNMYPDSETEKRDYYSEILDAHEQIYEIEQERAQAYYSAEENEMFDRRQAKLQEHINQLEKEQQEYLRSKRKAEANESAQQEQETVEPNDSQAETVETKRSNEEYTEPLNASEEMLGLREEMDDLQYRLANTTDDAEIASINEKITANAARMEELQKSLGETLEPNDLSNDSSNDSQAETDEEAPEPEGRKRPRLSDDIILKYEHKALGNDANIEFEWNGNKYPNVESAYIDAIGKNPSADMKARQNILEDIIRAKFNQHPELIEQLLSTGKRIILEDFNNGKDIRRGLIGRLQPGNKVGDILMKLRDEYRAGKQAPKQKSTRNNAKQFIKNAANTDTASSLDKIEQELKPFTMNIQLLADEGNPFAPEYDDATLNMLQEMSRPAEVLTGNEQTVEQIRSGASQIRNEEDAERYNNLISQHSAVIKDLTNEINSLKDKISYLKEQNDGIQAQIEGAQDGSTKAQLEAKLGANNRNIRKYEKTINEDIKLRDVRKRMRDELGNQLIGSQLAMTYFTNRAAIHKDAYTDKVKFLDDRADAFISRENILENLKPLNVVSGENVYTPEQLGTAIANGLENGKQLGIDRDTAKFLRQLTRDAQIKLAFLQLGKDILNGEQMESSMEKAIDEIMKLYPERSYTDDAIEAHERKKRSVSKAVNDYAKTFPMEHDLVAEHEALFEKVQLDIDVLSAAIERGESIYKNLYKNSADRIEDLFTGGIQGRLPAAINRASYAIMRNGVRKSFLRKMFKMDAAWNPVRGIAENLDTFPRYIRDVFDNETADYFISMYVAPVREGERKIIQSAERYHKMYDEMHGWSKEVKEAITHAVDIGMDETSIRTTYPQMADQVIKGAEIARKIFRELNDTINVVYARNGIDLLKRRANYVPHIKEENNSFFRSMGIYTSFDDLPTAMLGRASDYHPLHEFFRFSYERHQDSMDGCIKDITKLLDLYIPSALKQVYQTDNIVRLEDLMQTIDESGDYTDTGKDIAGGLSLVRSTVEKYMQTIAGKKVGYIDRAVETTFSRKFYSWAKALTAIKGQSATAANLNVVAANFEPLTMCMAMNPALTIRAIGDTISSMKTGRGDDMLQMSNFFIARNTERGRAENTYQKVVNALHTPAEMSDSFVTNVVCRATQYMIADKMGIDRVGYSNLHKQMILTADNLAANIMASRGRGEKVQFLNSSMGSIVGQFLLEPINNVMFMAKDLPKYAKAGNDGMQLSAFNGSVKALAILLAAFAQHELINLLAGRQVVSGPITDVKNAIEDRKEDESVLTTTKNAALNIAKDMNPFDNLLDTGSRATSGEFSIPVINGIPIVSGVETTINELIQAAEHITNAIDEKRNGTEYNPIETDWVSDIMSVWAQIMPGGVQTKRIYDTAKMASRGYALSEGKGRLKYAFKPTIGNLMLSGAFGPNSSIEGRDYVRRGYDTFSDDKTNEYLDYVKMGYDPYATWKNMRQDTEANSVQRQINTANSVNEDTTELEKQASTIRANMDTPGDMVQLPREQLTESYVASAIEAWKDYGVEAYPKITLSKEQKAKLGDRYEQYQKDYMKQYKFAAKKYNGRLSKSDAEALRKRSTEINSKLKEKYFGGD